VDLLLLNGVERKSNKAARKQATEEAKGFSI
jgi:hypothetical protein